MIEHDTFFIDGKWVAPAGTGTIEVVSPFTEEVVGRVPDATPADVDRAVAAARHAFDHGPWPQMTPAERADVMATISAKLNERADELATLISTENGVVTVSSASTPMVLGEACAPRIFLADRSGT